MGQGCVKNKSGLFIFSGAVPGTSRKTGSKPTADSSKDSSQYFENPVSSSRKIAANFDAVDNSIFSAFGCVHPTFGKTSNGAMTGNAVSSGIKSGRKDDGWKEVTRSFPSSRSKKVIVPSSVISRVIGRGGCNINAIREATGAHIEVEKQQKGQAQPERTIQIKGTAESTKQAHTLITALMNEPDLDVKKLFPLTSSSAPTLSCFTTGTFSLPPSSTVTASQRATIATSGSSPTNVDNTLFSTFVSAPLAAASGDFIHNKLSKKF